MRLEPAPPAFAVNNGSLSVPVVSAVSASGSSGNITVTYTLAETNGTPCSISVLYSIDNGTNYTATTNVTGTLTGVAPGSGKTLTWDSSVDIPGNQSAVKIRIIANNGSASSAPGESPVFAVSNNTLPEIFNVVASGNNGNISITYQLSDANNDACSIVFAYSVDDGVTFSNSTSVTGTLTGVTPGSGKTLTWNSAADISGNQNNVKVRLTPADAIGTGTAGISSAFVVTNNNLPVISAVTTSGSAGDITITYSLSDPNNDPCNISVSYSIDNGVTFNATANITGTLTGVTPGIGKTLTWDSKKDVPGNQSQVKIRIVANDGTGAGSPGDSAVFAISNNTLPVVSNVVASGTTGNFVLTFELVDANSDPCNVTVAYSTDGGTTFKQTSNLTGKTAGITPGVASLTWNSAADINGNEGNVKIRITPSDAVGSGTAGISPVFAVSNNNLPVVSAVTTSGSSGNITINYTLADPNNDACNITVYYSTDGGSNYIATTNLTGTLTAVTPGSGKTLTWNSAADVNGNSSSVRIKISASDGNGDGTPGESISFAVSNNTPPVVSSVIATGNVGNIAVSFNLADANSHPCSIGVFYSIDGGANYTATTNITGKTSGINPGVASITWNSAADINGNQTNVKIRIVPNDGIAEGTAGESAAFAVTNNNLPTVSNVTTVGSSGSITVSYNLSDPNNDPCNITVYYSTDNGANYTQTTNVSGTLTNVTPGSGKTLTWNSAADVNTNSSNVKIKIAASDNIGNGTPAESPVFAVNNNQLPVVSTVTTSGNSGDITISYTLADGNNDTCNIAVFYSTNDGSTYTQTTNFTGSATNVLPGAGKTLTWKSVQDVNRNVANVKIRLVPTDKVGTGTGAESATFAVNNNQLPVVSNVVTSGNSGNIAITFDLVDGNNDSCKVALAYSIDGGTTYVPTTSVIGNTTGITPGTGRSLSWNSTADVSSSQANVRVRVQPADSVGSGTAGISPAFAISNNQPPAVTNVVPSGSVGDITVTYTLADTNNDPCSIVFYYSIDGGTNYFQTGNVTGDTTGILPGASRSIVWNSSTDIPGSQSNVRVKIQPNDGTANGAEGQSAVFSVDNNNLPVASNVTTSGNSGNITVTYNLADANGDNCAISVFISKDNGTTFTQTTNISGTTTNIPPGTGKTITWDSTQDVTGNVAQVKVRIVPRDTTGTGAAADSAAFAVNNNSAPVVSNVVASGTYGDITVTYTLADNESDPCSISLAYSINGGTSYTATTNITGTVSGVAPGTRTLVWKSTLDFSSDQAAVRVRVTANDGNATSAPADSASFAVTNSNQPPTISSVTTTGTTGAITVNYTLADPNSDPCSIAVFYSTNGGANYAPTQNITGQTTEVAPGNRTILWNSPPDINGSIGNVRVRVVPTDRGGAGTGAESGIISVDNIGRPVVSNVTTSGGRGNITITYDYSDPNSDPGALQVWYSLDNGVNFIKSNSLTGQLTAITPGTGRTITWNSAAEVNGSYSQVKIRILMSDGTGIGTPGTSSASTLSNDGLPTVLRIVNTGNSGQIALSYDLLDPNNDLCSIEVFYSVDGGLNYTKTTNLMSGLQTQIVPGTGKTITWNSNLDILGYYPNSRIKIIASDPLGAGIPAESPLFMLRNNRLPAISSVSTSGNSGDISVTYTLADSDSDACSITPEYSTDNGINWFPTFSVTGSLTNVTPGAGKTFTWRSADDFLSTYSQVRLRLTPNDGVGNGTPGMTTAFAVANNSLPSITNVTTSGTAGAITVTFDIADSENNPCSVALHYSLNGEVSYSQSTFISGQTSNVLPGTGNVIVWESSNNVTTNVSDVRVRLVPNDGTGNGTAGVSGAFALNNDTNAAPAITELTRTGGTSGNITFTYTLADANGDACSVKLLYSTNGTFYQSSNISGATSGVLPGSGRTLIWNSVADVNSNVDNVLVKLVPQDARGEGTEKIADVFAVTNNTLPVVSNVAVTGDSGPISISYTLTDSNSDPCNITASFSIDGGLTYNPIASANISGSVSGVTPGANRSLTWNSGNNINGNQSGVRVSISADDLVGGAGTSGETVSFTVNNNKLPVASSVTTIGTSGDIVINYSLGDQNGHLCSIQVFYSIDGGVTWLPADDLVGGQPTGIAPGNHTVTWQSALVINRNQNGVRVRVVPSDQYGNGTAGTSPSFNIQNNQAPVVSAITNSGSTGNVVINYTLADANDNPCSILFYYYSTKNAAYTLSTNISGQTTGVTPGSGKVLTWNSSADVNTNDTAVKVRIVANDGTVSGTGESAAPFTILNNRAPEISNIRVSGTTGQIILTYDLADQNNDLASISVEYSTGGAFASATLLSAPVGVTPGANRSITWISASDISGNASARIRMVANDGLTSGSAVETAGFAVANNKLPEVKNVELVSGSSGNITFRFDLEDKNNNVCSMTVYLSVDNGVTYAQINPIKLSGYTSGLPGTGKEIIWDSTTEITGSSSQVKVKIVPSDSTGAGTPGETPTAFAVSNNNPPVVSAVTTSILGAAVTISYKLADAESHDCSVKVYFSTDGGTTYVNTEALSGGSIINLTSTPTGLTKTIVWNSDTDFKSNSGNIRVKVEPNDARVVGTSGISSTFALSNNTMPRVSVPGVPVVTDGKVEINYNLEDDEQNACSIEVFYSTNGSTYTRTTNLTGLTSNLAPATGRSITWNSGDDFTGKSDTVFVRVVANDGFGNGTPGVSGQFTVNNNLPPVVSNLVTTGDSGDITLSFNLADANGHTCDLSVDYYNDGSATWASATGITGTLVGVTPGIGRTLVWNSRGTFPGNKADVRLRITPSDPYETGVPVPTSAFPVNNNRAPSISNVVVSGNSGNISVTYSLADLDNNPCNVAVQYSTNGVDFYNATVSGNFSSVSPGNGINLVWDSVANSVNFSSNVRLRLTPNDTIVNGTAVDSAVFTVNNINELPTISNISITQAGKVATFTFDLADANNDQCSVAFEYSTNNGVNWTTPAVDKITGNLSGVTPGFGRKITWRNDVIGTLQSNVKVRLLPNDGKTNGNAGISSSFVVDNSPPVISNVRVTKRVDNDYDVMYDLVYPSAEPDCDVEIYYTTDDGTIWSFSVSATGVVPGSNRSLIWPATTNLPGPYYSARLEVRPVDGAIIGMPGTSSNFNVNNVDKPVVSFTQLDTQDPRGNTATTMNGVMTLKFDITDATSTGSFTAYVEYTVDAGASWSPITATGSLAGLTVGANVVGWDSYRDYSLTTLANKAQLRITVSDGDLLSDVVLSPLFTLTNGHKPDLNQRFIMVDSGYNHTAALADNGVVWIWGGPAASHMGDAPAIRTVPTQVGQINWQNTKEVACTLSGVLALGHDKTLRCIGTPTNGEFGNNSTAATAVAPGVTPVGLDGLVTSVACGYNHTLVILQDGTVRAFGNNTSGQLGDGTLTQRQTPMTVIGLADVKAVAAGGYNGNMGFSLALTQSGEVYSWGFNGQGQLGLNDTTNRVTPTKIPTLSGVKSIAAGSNHSLFLLNDGRVFFCGNNGAGGSSLLPVEVVSPLLVNIEKIVAGNAGNGTSLHGNSFAINDKGEVFAWGYSATVDIFGLNATTPSSKSEPFKIPGLYGITGVSVGKTNGTLTWATYVSNSSTGNSGIWNAGGNATNYMLGNNSLTAYKYFYHP